MIAIKRFKGIAPRFDPTALDGASAQVAINACLNNGSLQSFASHNFVTTPTKPGFKRTIYRFGQGGLDETLYWFTWVDDVDVVKGQIAGDTEETTFYSGDSAFGHPRVTNASIALMGGTDYPMNSYRLGVPAPGAAPTLVVSGTGDGSPADRSYVYTHVTGMGSESQPSPPGFCTCEDGQTVTVSGYSAPPAGHNVVSRRIYRTQEGNTTATDFMFVAERPIDEVAFADTFRDIDLSGETIPSLDWAPPPDTLIGLTNMSAGIMAGFTGYDVHFCVPYRPFAWPQAFRQPVDYPVVGLGAFGDNLVICTSGKPYIVTGTDPEQLIPKKLDLEEPCVSKRSIVSSRNGVMYASPSGLVVVGSGGSSLITGSIIDKVFWQSLHPESIMGVENEGRYIGFYDNGTTKGGFVFDPTNADAPFTMLDFWASAAFNDLIRDTAYFVDDAGFDIREWEGSAGPHLLYRWRSKQFSSQRKSMGLAMVVAPSYPITFRYFGDLALVHEHHVQSEKAFRLPSGRAYNTHEVEIVGVTRVTEIYVAANSTELQRALAEV